MLYSRKEPCREAWRRSWGSAASGGSAGDDLWPLLQHHYDYIMDNQIIDSCKVIKHYYVLGRKMK